MAVNIGVLEALLRLRDEMSPALLAAAKNIGAAESKLKSVGTALLPLTATMATVGVAAVTMATNFNRGMANVASLMPGNTKRVEELKRAVQDMAIATGKSTDDLTGGLYQVVSAFGDTADSAKILETNAIAAQAGLATVTEAINLTSAVTKSYGDTTAEAVQKASDLAVMTVRLGQTTFPELAASIGKVTPLAAELKITQEELFGAMATFTGVTGGAAEVSTQLRGAMQALLSPTDEMKLLLADLGVESGKALIEQKGLQGAMEAITQAVSSGKGELKDFVGSIEGQTVVLSAAAGQADALRQKTEAMKTAMGASAQAAKEQTEGVNSAGHAWDQLQQRLTVAGQRLGDAILKSVDGAGAMDKLGKAVEGAVSWFEKLPAGAQQTVLGIGAIAAAVGPAMVGLGLLSKAIMDASALLTTFGITVGAQVAALKLLGVAAAGVAAFALTTWFVENTEAGQKLVSVLADVINHLKGIDLTELERGTGVGMLIDNKMFQDQAGSRAAGIKAAREADPNYQRALAQAAQATVANAKAMDDAAKAAKRQADEQKKVEESLKEKAKREDEAAQKAKQHAEAIKQLADSLSGKALAQQMEDMVKAVKLAGGPGGINPSQWNEVATAVKNFRDAGLEVPPVLQAIADEAAWVARALAIVDAAIARAGERGPDDGLIDAEGKPRFLGGAGSTSSTIVRDGKFFREITTTIDELGKKTSEIGPLMQRIGEGATFGFRIIDEAGKKSTTTMEDFAMVVSHATDVLQMMGLEGNKTLAGLAGGLQSLATGNIMGAISSGAQLAESGGPLGTYMSMFSGGGFLNTVGGLLGGNEAGQVADMRDRLIEAQGGMREFGAAAAEAGVTLEQLFQAQTVAEYTAALQELEGAMEPTARAWEEVAAAAERYGFTTAELGPVMQAQALDQQVQQLYSDWQLLTASGIEHETVIRRMAPAMNEYVANVIAAGGEIPANMRPAIQAMADMGLLTDSAGNAMTSLEGLTFTDTLTQGMKEVVSEIRNLIAAMNDVPNIERTLTVRKVVTGDNSVPIGDSGFDIEAASGFHGYVNGPTSILAGEAGPERVDIGPVGSGGSAGGGMTEATGQAMLAEMRRFNDSVGEAAANAMRVSQSR